MDLKEIFLNETVIDPDVKFIVALFTPFFFSMLIIQLAVITFIGNLATANNIPDASMPMVYLLFRIMEMVDMLMIIYLVGILISGITIKKKFWK